MNKISPNTATAMAEHWNGRADRFQQSPSHIRMQGAWGKVFAAAIGSGSGRAVDLGCGTGACALELASLGYHVTAVDGSEQMLAHARSAASTRGLSIDFVHADMDSLRPGVVMAEVVTIRNVLWTLEHPEQAIRLASRLLRPGGKLLVSDGLWRMGLNDSAAQFGSELPNFNGVCERDARTWLIDAGFSLPTSWQHLFEAHPYGRKYDTDDDADQIEFFVLMANNGGTADD